MMESIIELERILNFYGYKIILLYTVFCMYDNVSFLRDKHSRSFEKTELSLVQLRVREVVLRSHPASALQLLLD